MPVQCCAWRAHIHLIWSLYSPPCKKTFRVSQSAFPRWSGMPSLRLFDGASCFGSIRSGQRYMSPSGLVVHHSMANYLLNTDPDNQTSFAKHLQLLRNKAHPWFKFDECSQNILHTRAVTFQNSFMWDEHEDLVMILPMPSKPSNVNDLQGRHIQFQMHAPSMCS
jgi:hypothetical protein